MPIAPIPATAEGLPINLNRRRFLAAAPAAAGALLPIPALAVTSPPETPQEELDRAVGALFAAMTRIHGEGVRIIRNGNSGICVMAPDRPELFNFTGAGLYEVQHEGGRPIWRMERAPEHDDPAGYGRAFWVTPQFRPKERSLKFDIALTGKFVRFIRAI
ncbi:twin-arginine translocation signal domain-containing protein [Rhizobium alvei]|uniref:Twin-arginine translocation signal domain-containing protein n=1 Tax=Rhizobium alvei TaxID=1132659 RepID=A0ABT8YKD8_9HYPH|nr:twin-arginine translocation signal domain-containing protein [Rhizobium alvei]MDO6963996.1 twin-arginine translocation signal domain-containing protein [Rhizobium alvei]